MGRSIFEHFAEIAGGGTSSETLDCFLEGEASGQEVNLVASITNLDSFIQWVWYSPFPDPSLKLIGKVVVNWEFPIFELQILS